MGKKRCSGKRGDGTSRQMGEENKFRYQQDLTLTYGYERLDKRRKGWERSSSSSLKDADVVADPVLLVLCNTFRDPCDVTDFLASCQYKCSILDEGKEKFTCSLNLTQA